MGSCVSCTNHSGVSDMGDISDCVTSSSSVLTTVGSSQDVVYFNGYRFSRGHIHSVGDCSNVGANSDLRLPSGYLPPIEGDGDQVAGDSAGDGRDSAEAAGGGDGAIDKASVPGSEPKRISKIRMSFDSKDVITANPPIITII